MWLLLVLQLILLLLLAFSAAASDASDYAGSSAVAYHLIYMSCSVFFPHEVDMLKLIHIM